MPDLLQQVAQGQGSQAEREQVFASECAPGCADKPAPSLTDKQAPSLTTAEKVTSEGSSELAYFVELNQIALALESHQMLQHFDAYVKSAERLFKGKPQLSMAVDGSRFGKQSFSIQV